jgi:hypothetical protein
MYVTSEQNIIKVRLNYSVIVLFHFNIKVWIINLKQRLTKLSTVKREAIIYFILVLKNTTTRFKKIKELKTGTIKKKR